MLAACLLLASLGAAAAPSAQVVTYSSSWSSRPVVRIAQDYFLGAGEHVSDVRLVFGNATIEGQVDGDLVVVFGEARLTGDAVVDGSVVVVGGSAEIAPTVSVDRDVVVVGGTLTGEGFSRGGDQVVVGSVWLGDILRGIVPWMTRGLVWGRLIVPDIGWVWTFVGIFFLLYLALNVMFDRAVGACADTVGARPVSTFMSGLLVLLLVLPVLAILMATVIGLLLVPFILCAILVAGLLGKAGVVRAIGRTIIGAPSAESPESRGRAVAAFVVGFALLTLAYMVPVLGFVTWAITTVFAFGAGTATFRAMLRKERPAAPAAAAAEPAPEGASASDTPALPVATPATYAALAAPPAPRTEPEERSERVEPREPRFSSGLAAFPRATFLDRAAAFALDCILVAIAAEMLDWSRFEGFYPFLLLVYHILFWTWRGTTLGGIIIGLRVIRTHGAELRPADAVVRGLSSIFSIAALGIGCFWMLQDPENQTWHDKIAGTLVVKVPRDQVLP